MKSHTWKNSVKHSTFTAQRTQQRLVPAHTGCYRLPALTRNGWPSEIYFVSLGLLEAGALVAAARHGEALDHVLPGCTCGTMPPPVPTAV